MATKSKECRLEDTSTYDKLCEFLGEPDDANELNEATPARNYREWRYVARGYTKIFTSGSRQFFTASQVHDAIDAVIETPWTRRASALKTGNVVKYTPAGTDPVYYAILAVINVNEDNQKLRLICRKSDAQQNQQS